jgi:long-chain acyl-CoA synthetase
MGIMDRTIVKVFQEKVLANGDSVFVKRFKGGQWHDITWREYGETVETMASALLELGITKGSRVCIMSSTCAEWGMADLAKVSIGPYSTFCQ